MARPIWNGTISFGLLNVPVQLFPGERSVDLNLRMLDSRDENPIRYERINSETGEEVPWKDIVKAFEFSKGNYVVIDEETLKKAHPEATETVEIEAFVPRDAITPRYFEKPYYLVPAAKAEILDKTRKVGIAKVVIRTRQYLAAVMPIDEALLLNLMRFPQELIAPDEYRIPAGSLKQYRISAKEVEMGQALVESMSADWKPDDYKDDFREKLRGIVDAQVKKKRGRKRVKEDVKAPEPEPETTNVVDFMALLKKSIEGKGSRPRSPAKRKPAKRAG
jgi:DNA end-binding protein Ku